MLQHPNEMAQARTRSKYLISLFSWSLFSSFRSNGYLFFILLISRWEPGFLMPGATSLPADPQPRPSLIKLVADLRHSIFFQAKCFWWTGFSTAPSWPLASRWSRSPSRTRRTVWIRWSTCSRGWRSAPSTSSERPARWRSTTRSASCRSTSSTRRSTSSSGSGSSPSPSSASWWSSTGSSSSSAPRCAPTSSTSASGSSGGRSSTPSSRRATSETGFSSTCWVTTDSGAHSLT